jgi:hypothetical protein
MINDQFQSYYWPYQPGCPNCGYCPHCGRGRQTNPWSLPTPLTWGTGTAPLTVGAASQGARSGSDENA